MQPIDIIRAWKDKNYRMSLSAEQLAQLPEHPAGLIELTDTELQLIGGGSGGTGGSGGSGGRKSYDRSDACSAACLPPRSPKCP